MKVLLLSPMPPPSGGIASWTLNLLEYSKLNLSGIEIYHLDTGLKYREILNDNFLYRIYFGFYEGIRIFRELKKNIRDHSPDIIHLTSTPSLALIKDYIILKIARKHRIPLIIHWHFGTIPSLLYLNNWEWKFLSFIMRNCIENILIDNESYETLSNAGFSNIKYIPNPISLNLEEKIKVYSAHPVKKNKSSLIFVGHVIREKGIFELIEASSQIPLIRELLIVGPYYPSIKEELIAISKKKGNSEWLKFYGNLDNDMVLEMIRSSDILLLPSYTEGFPMVVLEAMSMGCAVITSDVGALPEMLAVSSDKPCGICVPARSIEKLLHAIQTLTNDPAKAKIMGENGRERVMINYTFNQVMGLYKSTWNKALTYSSSMLR